MKINQLIKKCLIDDDAIVTYPFKDTKGDNNPILRHKSNNKWFGVIFEQNDTLYINLKAKPIDISVLRDQYPDVILPAWHMNKQHWYKVDVNKIDKKLFDRLIKNSFDITKPKARKQKIEN